MNAEQVTRHLRGLVERSARTGEQLSSGLIAQFELLRDVIDDKIDELDAQSEPALRQRLAQVPARLARLRSQQDDADEDDSTAQRMQLRGSGGVVTTVVIGRGVLYKVGGAEPLTLTKTTPTIHRRARLTPICRDDLVSDGWSVWTNSF